MKAQATQIESGCCEDCGEPLRVFPATYSEPARAECPVCDGGEKPGRLSWEELREFYAE